MRPMMACWLEVLTRSCDNTSTMPAYALRRLPWDRWDEAARGDGRTYMLLTAYGLWIGHGLRRIGLAMWCRVGISSYAGGGSWAGVLRIVSCHSGVARRISEPEIVRRSTKRRSSITVPLRDVSGDLEHTIYKTYLEISAARVANSLSTRSKSSCVSGGKLFHRSSELDADGGLVGESGSTNELLGGWLGGDSYHQFRLT